MTASNLAAALDEKSDVAMGKVLRFPSERRSEPVVTDADPLGDLFDDPLDDKTVAEDPWHELPIAPQPIVSLSPVPVPVPVPVPASPPPPPAPLPITAAPIFFVPKTITFPSPASAPPPSATSAPSPTPTLATPRVEILPARNAWALAFVCVALTLALMIPAVALVAYFAVRTGDSPVIAPATTATTTVSPSTSAR